MAEAIQASIHASEAMLLGRVTYEMFAAYWPAQTNSEFGIADMLNSQPKFVVFSTMERAAWNNTTVIKGNVTEEIRMLKPQPGGDIRLSGSATLAQALMQAGPVDEYWLLVHPVVLGRGKRLKHSLPSFVMNTPILQHFGIRSAALLGRGGESQVYELDRTRVLRIYPSGTSLAAIQARQNFYTQLAARHPPFVIPTVLDHGVIDEHPYTIEQRMHGHDFARVLPQLTGRDRARALTSYLDLAT